MWSRRRFLEAASGLPVVGGLVGAVTLKAVPAAAMAQVLLPCTASAPRATCSITVSTTQQGSAP